MPVRTLRSTTRLDVDVKSAARSHLSLNKGHLAELEAIWTTDPRVPTTESRRAWAEARCIEPAVVHSWFTRKLSRRKEQGLSVSGGSYELDPGHGATDETTAPPRKAADQVKRERSPSPLLVQPWKRRCKTDASARTGSSSSSRPRKVKVEGEARRLLPVRHTRRHDTNPHPACLTCLRTHTTTFPEDLPPSSPPPSSPPATPPLTFSSDSLSSDAELGSPLTPVASDDEEANIDAYLVSSPSDVGRTRIYPPIRKPVPRSVKRFTFSGAYTDSLLVEGPSATAFDGTEEILSFSPSPEPVSRPRKKRKRVAFSDETTTFFVDPLRSFHRFSYDFDLEDAASTPAKEQEELPVSPEVAVSATPDTAPGCSPTDATESSATGPTSIGLTTPSTVDTEPSIPVQTPTGLAAPSFASAQQFTPPVGIVLMALQGTQLPPSPPAGSLSVPTVSPVGHSSWVSSSMEPSHVSPAIARGSSVPEPASASVKPSLKLRLRAPTPALSVGHPYHGQDTSLVSGEQQTVGPASPPGLSLDPDTSQPEPIEDGPHNAVISALHDRESVVATHMQEAEVMGAVKPEMEEIEVVCIPGETHCDVCPWARLT